MTSLQQKLNQLNLTTMSEHLDETLADAASKNLSAAEAFEALLDRELEARQTRSIDRRFRLSRLQAKHSIDSFHFNHHKTRLQRSEEHTSELQSRGHLVCRLLLEKKNTHIYS